MISLLTIFYSCVRFFLNVFCLAISPYFCTTNYIKPQLQVIQVVRFLWKAESFFRSFWMELDTPIKLVTVHVWWKWGNWLHANINLSLFLQQSPERFNDKLILKIKDDRLIRRKPNVHYYNTKCDFEQTTSGENIISPFISFMGLSNENWRLNFRWCKSLVEDEFSCQRSTSGKQVNPLHMNLWLNCKTLHRM